MASHPYNQQQQQKALQQRAPPQTYVRPTLPQTQYPMTWPSHHHGQSMGIYPNPSNTNGQIVFSAPPMAMPSVIYPPHQISLPPGPYQQQRPTQQYYNPNSPLRIMPPQYQPYQFYPGQQHGVPPPSYYYPSNNQPLNNTASVPAPCMSPQSGAPRGMNSLSAGPTGPMRQTVTPPGIVPQSQPPDIRSQTHPSIPPHSHIGSMNSRDRKGRSKAVPIIDPVTGRDVSQEIFEEDTPSIINEKKSQTTNGSSVAEEFARLVSDAARSTDTTENKDSLTNSAVSKDSVIVPVQKELLPQAQFEAIHPIIPDNITEDQCDIEFGSIEKLEIMSLEIQNSTENSNANDIISSAGEPLESILTVCEVPKNLESVPTDVALKSKVTQHSQRATVKNHTNRQGKQARSKPLSGSKESINKEISLSGSHDQHAKQDEDLSPSRQDIYSIASLDTVGPLQISEKESTSTVADSNDTNNNSESKNKIVKQNLTNTVIEPLQLNIDKSVINSSQIFSEVTFAQKSINNKPPFGGVPPFADTNRNIVSETPIQTSVKPLIDIEILSGGNISKLQNEFILSEFNEKETVDTHSVIPNSVIVDDIEKQQDNISDRIVSKPKAFFDPNFNINTELSNIEHRNHKSKTVDETDRSNPPEFMKPSFVDNKDVNIKVDKNSIDSFLTNKPKDSSQPLSNVSTRRKPEYDFSMKFQKDIPPLVKPDISKSEKIDDIKPHDNTINVPNLHKLSDEKSTVIFNTSMSNGMKRKYDKDFLLSLRNKPSSICEPNLDDFDGIDSVLKQRKSLNSFGVPSNKNESLSGGRSVSQRASIPKRMSQQGKPSPGSGNMSNMKPGVIHVSLSLHVDVKLNETENAWKPSIMKAQPIYASKELEETEKLLKEVRGILNKITPQKYETLLKKMKGLDIDTPTKLDGVIDLIWDKAIFEPNFATFYAQLCKDLKSISVDVDMNRHSLSAKIIQKCQAEFEKDKKSEDSEERQASLKAIKECSDPLKKAELVATLDEEERKVRMRSVGNIRFIGELFNLNFLSSTIMMQCIETLLKSEDDETLECLCKLLTTIGEILEMKCNLSTQFDKMQSIVNRRDSKINSRVRFMLQDVIELRNNKWVPRRTEAKPKTMDQIKQEADSEHLQIQIMNSSSMGSRKDDNKQGGGRRSNRGGSSNRNDDEWTLNSSRTRVNIDSQKLNKLKPLDIRETKLGPATMTWSRGSIVKSAASRSMGESFAQTSFSSTNIFNSLKTEPDPVPYTPSKNVLKDDSSRAGSVEGVVARNHYGVGSQPESQRSSRSNSSSRNEDSSKLTRENTPQATNAPATELTEEQIKKVCQRVHNCMEEYFAGLTDDKAVLEEIREMFNSSNMLLVLEEIIKIAVDKSAPKLHMLARAVTVKMVEAQLISSDQYFECVSSKILSIAPELLLDIPKIYQYLSVLLAPHIKDGRALASLFQGSGTIIEARQGASFLGRILKQLLAEGGQNFVFTVWKESNLELAPWMPNSDANEFMKLNEMSFLNERHTPDQMQESVFQLMQQNRTQSDIDKWIDQNVGEAIAESQFLRALSKAICKDALMPPGEAFESRPRFCSKSQERLNRYVELLSKHIQRDQARQLQCLLAIQQLIHAFEHPQGVTLQLFNYLLETDVICVDAFLDWEQNGDPHEQEGRGVMIMSLNSFFASIKETSSEQYEDSCEED